MAERRTTPTSASRLRPLIPLAAMWLSACLFLTLLLAQNQVPYDQLLLDPNSVNKVPWYTGLISNLGILGWTTATATGFFGAWVAHYGSRPSAATLLRRGAVLSTILLLDDLFQLHVAVKPLFGVSKPMVYVAYLAVAAWWAVTQRREIRRTRSELLVAAVLAFGTSIVADQIAEPLLGLGPQTALVVEDAAKFLGVLAWAQYFVLTSVDIATSILNDRSRDRSPNPATPQLREPDHRRYDQQNRERSRTPVRHGARH